MAFRAVVTLLLITSAADNLNALVRGSDRALVECGDGLSRLPLNALSISAVAVIRDELTLGQKGFPLRPVNRAQPFVDAAL